MKFVDAVEAVVHKRLARRNAWMPGIFMTINELNFLEIISEETIHKTYDLHLDDIFAEDWQVLD